MPSKKKKYNSRFPPARIKKIMQTDEDIGKVAAAVPVLISKCLEMFLTSLLTKAGDVTKSKRAKTMSRMHLKECIMSETMFDFLQDQVAHIQDLQGDEEPAMSSGLVPDADTSNKVTRKRSLPKSKKSSKKRMKLNEGSGHESDSRNDYSDDGISNETNEPSYSSSLLSDTSEMKHGLKSSTSHGEGEAGPSKRSRSMHIPLDVLMTNKEISTSAKLERSSSVQDKKTIPSGTKTEHDTESFRKLETSTDANPLKFDPSCVRQGVIVANSSVRGTSYMPMPPTFAQTPFHAGHTTKQEPTVARVSTTMPKDVVTEHGQEKVLQGNYPAADSQRESMLSLLHSSMPIPAPVTPDSPTVLSNTPPTSHQKYAYNPLSQQPRPPVYYSNLQASINGGPTSSYSKQIPPYIPAATQRHFLGYPQTMLTPPGQNPLLAVHSGMAQMKPTPRTRSDDDDDYDT